MKKKIVMDVRRHARLTSPVMAWYLSYQSVFDILCITGNIIPLFPCRSAMIVRRELSERKNARP